MKSHIILIITIVILNTGCNRKVEKIYYPNGKIKQKITFKDGNKECEFKSYYENGQIKVQGTYKKDKQEGTFIWYYENGTIETKSFFINDKENGKVEQYYETDILKLEGIFRDGKPDGIIKMYYPNGKIEKEVNFNNGQECGDYKSYFQTGQLELFAIRENDSTTVYYKKYNEKGKVIDEYHQVSIEPLKKEFYVGESFKARIRIFGPIKGKKVMIVPYLFGIDKKSGMYENKQEVIYTSSTIKIDGKYYFKVNVFIDTICYNNELFINILPSQK